MEGKRVVALFLASLVLLASSASVQGKGSIAAYWGQGADSSVEGTLAQACQSGNYGIVIVAFIAVFGNGQTPELNLAGHCDPSSGGCVGYSSDIDTCHANGVKVLLSLGGGAGAYELVSAQDAEDVANYLWNNYLGGHSDSRPLGPAILDGIDLDIEGGSPLYYSNLAQTLKSLAKNAGLTLYLSAAPQCPFPDAYDGPGAGTALATGLFDYVWVQFYNNYCQYQGGLAQELSVWDQWTAALPNAKIFMGLPASTSAAGTGFVAGDVVTSDILPQIKKSSNYGGVMLWSVYYDQITSFSSSIAGGL